MKRAPQFARNLCAIGQSQKLDLKDDSAVLAALRLVARTSATIGGQMLSALAIESKAPVDPIQTGWEVIRRFIQRAWEFITVQSRSEKVTA